MIKLRKHEFQYPKNGHIIAVNFFSSIFCKSKGSTMILHPDPCSSLIQHRTRCRTYNIISIRANEFFTSFFISTIRSMTIKEAPIMSATSTIFVNSADRTIQSESLLKSEQYFLVKFLVFHALALNCC